MRALLISILFFVSFAYAETDVEFVFDVSGSMAKELNGEKQIDIARKALINNLKQIPAEQLVAVRVFAHRVEQTNKEESCKDTELIFPFAKADTGSIALALSSLSPKGYTPIAYSLEKAAEDMIAAGKSREPERVIILLSDGEETCGGDPVAVLQRLKDQGFKVIVHTIGFNVNDVARKQLQDIANFSGGKYFDATDATKLGEAFEEATKETYLIEKNKEEIDANGLEVRGGDGFLSAVEFKKEWLGKELKLDHHQKREEFDYFYLDVEAGTHVELNVKNFEKHIEFNKSGVPVEAKDARQAGLSLHDSKYEKIKEIRTANKNFDEASGFKTVRESGRYYIRYGSFFGYSLHKEGASFMVNLEIKGDADTDKDAGSSLSTALPIEVNRKYEKNYMGGSDNDDSADMFKFEAKKGDKLSFHYNSLSTSNWPTVDAELYDAYNSKIRGNQRGRGVDSPMLATFVAPEDGTFYLKLRSDFLTRVHQYTFELKIESAAPVREGVDITEESE